MKNYVTRSGYDQMCKELDYLMTVDSKNATEMLKDAKDKGDLSENAEYEAARDYQNALQKKILNLSNKINLSTIIIQPDNTDSVEMLTKVLLHNHTSNKDVEWSLVPENEINIKEGKISFNSPIGAALLGRQRGETVDVKIPIGTMKLEILDIKYLD